MCSQPVPHGSSLCLLSQWHWPREAFLPPPTVTVTCQHSTAETLQMGLPKGGRAELQQQTRALPAYSTQSTAGEQAGEITKKTKTQSISILYHTGSISLQHCRLQNFYHISQYRSSEINQRDESIFHVLKLVLTATGSHKTLLSIKEMDFLFRVWSKAARALLKQFMLKVLKHSASRFKPRSATGNHRGASFGRGNYPMFYTWDYPMFNICNFIFSVSPDNSYS